MWYYETVADTLIRRYRTQLTRDLQDEVDRLLALAGTLRDERRRDALLRRLLERVGDLDQLRLAALRADEADADTARAWR